jgi:hypothetical protein
MMAFIMPENASSVDGISNPTVGGSSPPGCTEKNSGSYRSESALPPLLVVAGVICESAKSVAECRISDSSGKANGKARRIRLKPASGWPRTGPMVSCSHCGKSFRAWSSHASVRNAFHYCSPTCKAAGLAARVMMPATDKQKYDAHNRIQMDTSTGKLVRPDHCDECGRTCKPDAHHDDYDAKRDVKWLCRSCHMKRHHQLALAS